MRPTPWPSAIRAGYSDVKQLTLGAGLRFPKLQVDYSFAKFDATNQLGNTHRISLLFTLETDDYRRTGGGEPRPH